MSTNAPSPAPAPARPVWFLDVDGVLNSWDAPSPRRFPGYRTLDVQTPHGAFPVVHHPGIVDALVALTDVVDVVWLTSWGAAAADGLAPAIGLPEFPVAGEEHYARSGTLTDLSALYCDGPLDERAAVRRPGVVWWKWAAVRDWMRAHPDTPAVVWTDDELYRASKDTFRAVFPDVAFLGITTQKTPGLTLANLSAVAAFLAAQQ